MRSIGSPTRTCPSNRSVPPSSPAARRTCDWSPKGERESLEDVIEETRHSPRWAGFFKAFHDPYLHLTPGQYADLAERNGLRVSSLRTAARAWDFQSRAAFQAFGSVTFVEWTQHLPEAERSRLRHRRSRSLPARSRGCSRRRKLLPLLPDGYRAGPEVANRGTGGSKGVPSPAMLRMNPAFRPTLRPLP